MTLRPPRMAIATIAVGVVLVGIFAALVLYSRAGLHAEVRRAIIGRDAAVLLPIARQQIAERESHAVDDTLDPSELLSVVLQSAQQEGMLAIATYDASGALVRSVPANLVFAELGASDFITLLGGEPLSRFHPEFPLDRYFSGLGTTSRVTPVLEVLLPLRGRLSDAVLGFGQYYIDARALSGELAAIDTRDNGQTAATLAIGAASIIAVLAIAYAGLWRAQRALDERNERLMRANFELTLAAKASALGQITSHLIHGLQGPVAGLRAVVGGRGADGSMATPDWATAVGYTERMETLIQEAVGLLSDAGAQATYELTGAELAETIRVRNRAAAAERSVVLHVQDANVRKLDNHRGSLLCLIATNLVQNAIAATPPGRHVQVTLQQHAATVILVVADEGHGIPGHLRERLFEPGATGRTGGTGLGLAISQLLARQVGATLALVSTGASGTTFQLTLPAAPA